MMDRSVPVRSSAWFGTGTVVVVAPVLAARCIIMWLPRWRTKANPWRCRIAHTSLPESRRSLPNDDLHLGHKHVALQALLDLLGRCTLEKQLDRLAQVVPGLLDRIALA